MTITNLARHGGWFCVAEQKFTEPTEASIGNVFQVCASCGASGTLRWTPPTLTGANDAMQIKRHPRRRKHRFP